MWSSIRALSIRPMGSNYKVWDQVIWNSSKWDFVWGSTSRSSSSGSDGRRSGCEEINTDQSLTEQRLELRRRTDWPLLGQNERHTLFGEKKELVLSRAEKEYSGGEKRLGRIQGLGKRRKILASLHQHDQLFFLPWAWTPWFSLCVFFFYFPPSSPSSSLSPPSIEGASLAFRQLFSFREFWRRLSKSEKLWKGNCRTSIALKMYVVWGQSKKEHKYWWCLTFYSEKGQTEAHGQTWP